MEFPRYGFPVKISPKLTSTFGEYRKSNQEIEPHFHFGVDFSTNWKVGLGILAVQDGYVRRVVIDKDDLYGYQVVIVHPAGYISLYAHLSAFAGNIQKIADMLENEFWGSSGNESINKKIVVKFEPNDIPVKRGEVIGYSGKTGEASVPHCHLEIRSKDEKWVYNPLMFLNLKDDRAPIIVDEISINGVKYTSDEIENSVVYVNGTTFPDIKISTAEKSGYNVRGIYKIQMKVDNRLVFELRFDKMKLDEFRKGGIIYSENSNSFSHLYNLTVPSNVILSPIKINKTHSISVKRKCKIDIIVSNFWGREKKIDFFIEPRS